MPQLDEEFSAFVASQGTGLRRLAYAVCGDWHRADDLVQGALERCFVHWRRVQGANDRGAYVRTILIRLAVSEGRRPWRSREVSVERLPEAGPGVGGGGGHRFESGDRLDVARALQHLTPKQRAIVVLRYLEDRPVSEVAGILGVSEGTVKRQSYDAVRVLRAGLTDPEGVDSRV